MQKVQIEKYFWSWQIYVNVRNKIVSVKSYPMILKNDKKKLYSKAISSI